MQLEHFRYLLEIDKRRSISAASKALFMGQTTLSSIVKSVEEELGFPIFQRTPSGVTATANGERLMALAWEIGVKYEELQNLKSRKTTEAFPIVVLLSPSVNLGASLPVMERFYAENTNSTLIFELWPRTAIFDQIAGNNANMGVTYLHREEIEHLGDTARKYKVAIKPVLSDRFYLVAARNHPLAGRFSVSLQELYDESLAMATTFSLSSDIKLLADISRRATRVTYFPAIHMIKQAILEQGMVSILTGLAYSQDPCYPPELFRTVELTGFEAPNQLEICLLYRTQKNLRYPEKTLLLCIEEYFNQVSLDIPD